MLLPKLLSLQLLAGDLGPALHWLLVGLAWPKLLMMCSWRLRALVAPLLLQLWLPRLCALCKEPRGDMLMAPSSEPSLDQEQH